MYTSTQRSVFPGPVTTFSVSTDAPACWVTQLGSFAMSIGFIFGGVPVYVTLPLMVPAAPGGPGGAAPTMLADRASPPVMRTVARTAMECVRISSLLPSSKTRARSLQSPPAHPPPPPPPPPPDRCAPPPPRVQRTTPPPCPV